MGAAAQTLAHPGFCRASPPSFRPAAAARGRGRAAVLRGPRASSAGRSISFTEAEVYGEQCRVSARTSMRASATMALTRHRAEAMRQTLDFLLHDWLGVAALLQRAALRRPLARDLRLGARHLRAHRAREVRAVQPRSPTPRSRASTASGCTCPQATHAALAAYVESGMLAAAQDYDIGGMQLPCVVEMAANAFFQQGQHRHRRLRAC